MKPAKDEPGLIFTLIMVLITVSFAAGALVACHKEQIIKITAKKFEYSPSEIRIKKGVPVVLELTSLDRMHGFNCKDLGVRSTIEPGKVYRVRIVPQKAGTYEFRCDVFCGEGHEDMTGKIIVEE